VISHYFGKKAGSQGSSSEQYSWPFSQLQEEFQTRTGEEPKVLAGIQATPSQPK